MDSYFQKISSRSGDMFPGNEPAPVLLQPEARPVLAEDADPFETSELLNPVQHGASPVVRNLSPVPIPESIVTIEPGEAKISPKESEQNNDAITVKKEQIFHEPVDVKQVAEKTVVPLPQKEGPIAQIIERINERNNAHTLVIERNNENTINEKQDVFFMENKIEPLAGIFGDEKKGTDKKEKSGQRDVLPVNEKSKPLIAEKAKEKIQPIQQTAFVALPATKAQTTSKLVIGRITIEVMNPAQPTLKTREPVVKQNNNAGNVASNEFTAINKLHFGFGQL